MTSNPSKWTVDRTSRCSSRTVSAPGSSSARSVRRVRAPTATPSAPASNRSRRGSTRRGRSRSPMPNCPAPGASASTGATGTRRASTPGRSCASGSTPDHLIPEIRRFPEVPIEAREWQAERSTASDIRYRSVWVANHPPLHYVAVAPLIWGSRVVEASDGGLILMRFANVAFAAVGVVFTFLLALEITRRNQRLALLAAALAALVPQGHAVFSQGLNDGLGFAAGTALVWAGARCIRRMDDLTRRDLVILAVAAVVGFGARAATMLLAVLVVGVVALARLVHPERPDPSVAERLRGAAGLVVLALGPAVLAFGWFYARNWVLYGDIGASQYLLEMFRREERGSVLEMFNRPVIWSNVFEGLLSPSTRQRLAPPGAAVLTLVAGVGVAFALITGRLRVSAEPTDDQRVLRWQIGLCLATVAMIATTIAQHASGGGRQPSCARTRATNPSSPTAPTRSAMANSSPPARQRHRRSAGRVRSSVAPGTRNSVMQVSRHLSSSSRILSGGPTSATSSTIASGIAAAASAFLPSRYSSCTCRRRRRSPSGRRPRSGSWRPSRPCRRRRGRGTGAPGRRTSRRRRRESASRSR
jgi:hypothetical protein